jgi:hypothetical protein
MTHAEAVRAAARAMNDYRLIKTGPGRSRDKLAPGQTVDAYKTSIKFIERTLADARPIRTRSSLRTWPRRAARCSAGSERPERIRDMDGCYSSHCEAVMAGGAAPALWLHGQIHAGRDYTIGNTRWSSTRGYPGPRCTRENPKFDPSLVVELEPRIALGMRM